MRYSLKIQNHTIYGSIDKIHACIVVVCDSDIAAQPPANVTERERAFFIEQFCYELLNKTFKNAGFYDNTFDVDTDREITFC